MGEGYGFGGRLQVPREGLGEVYVRGQAGWETQDRGEGMSFFDDFLMSRHPFSGGVPRQQIPHRQTPFRGFTTEPVDITIKKMYVSVPIKHAPGEILVESCGCSSHGGERLRTCDECLQRRLGP